MIITLKTNNILALYTESGFSTIDIKYLIFKFYNVDKESIYSSSFSFIKKDTITRITKLCTKNKKEGK